MITLRVRLSPLAPYFLGGERCDAYGTFITQQASINPYFLKSRKIPSQTALFGVLRYLGIRNPQADFSIEKSEDYIGKQSFDLTAKESRSFGKIKRISPLMLMDDSGGYWCFAPKNQAYTKEGKLVEFDKYGIICSMFGKHRYLPLQFEEKNKGSAMFAKVTGNQKKWLSEDDVFDSVTQVGINRSMKDAAENSEERSGFFKREFAVMKPGYEFVFFADMDDDAFGETDGYTKEGVRIISIGRYNAAFKAEWSPVDCQSKPDTSLISQYFIKNVAITDMTGEESVESTADLYYAWAISDIYYPGKISDLRARCDMMITGYREQRVFTTNYDYNASAKRRYVKHEEALKLISAGSVFIFSETEKMDSFKNYLESQTGFEHSKIAGYNCIYYSGKDEQK